MDTKMTNNTPKRITNLIHLKEAGADLRVSLSFEIVPVVFQHRDNPFQAHIFLARFSGTVDGSPFSFRKCYARGCPHNLCPHVSQAVMIANRYLQRDYQRLKRAGIDPGERLFTLEDMVVKFEESHEEKTPALTIDDYIHIAEEGSRVSAKIDLEYVPAVEHFVGEKNAQTFLSGNFHFHALGNTHIAHRCFACYPTDREDTDREDMRRIANERLQSIYADFDRAGVLYERTFFS